MTLRCAVASTRTTGFLGFYSSPSEYYLELGRHILLFSDTLDFFGEDLIAIAIQVR